MTIYDFSKAPCTVTITNTSDKDMKVNLSGHSQSFILSAGASAELQATSSSDLIGYLSQLRPGLTVRFPGLPGLGLIPGEYTVLSSDLFTDDGTFPEGSVIQGPPFGLVAGQHYLLTYTIDGGEEIQLPLVAIAMPVSETESVLVCTAYGGDMPELVEDGAFIIMADGEAVPLEERVEDEFLRANPEVGTLILINGSPNVDIAGSVINLLSLEEVATPSCTISTTVAGCTLTIVDADSNVYNNLDAVPFGTELTITGVADEGYAIDTFTVNGDSFGSGYISYGTTYTVTGDVEIVLTSRDALFDLSIAATGCTVTVTNTATQTEYVAGSNVIPVRAVVTITVTPEAGYSANGMIITADGNAINNGDQIIVNGDLAIVATALELFSVTHTALVDANLTSLTISDGTTSYVAGQDSFEDIFVAGTPITITAVADETTYTTTGMTFTVNGEDYTNGSAITVTGDLTLVLAAATI